MSYNIETVRHSLAHVLAAAMKKLYPEIKIAGGPAIENGFYYDFDYSTQFTPDDFSKIEKEMKDIIKSNGRFTQKIVSLEEAEEIFKDEPYKTEWIHEYHDKGWDLSIYSVRDFTDLCKGPHVESTKDLPKSFKIRGVAGAYWKGDSKNKMLQRVYVDAFATEEELNNFLKMREEAEKRDHRKLGAMLDLFHFEPEFAPGMIFWHDKGYKIYRKLIEFMRQKQNESDYLEVETPRVMDRCLWETSGHWDKYGAHNYSGKTEDEKVFCIKPMNCPGGILIYKQGIKSYKDLPIKMAEFGKVNRYEPSGSLHGILRAREFTQDDAHIFCTPEQLESECVKVVKFILDIYKTFGFDDVLIKLSTRPDSKYRIGSDEIWDMSEKALADSLTHNGYKYELQEGEGAFYGPKLEFTLFDSLGRAWQMGTLQLDMNLPERFDCNYIAEDGTKHQPIMLHRAILGSIERFLGILIETYSGAFPLWLAPVQAIVVPISDKHTEYADKVYSMLKKAGIDVQKDYSNESMQKRILLAHEQKIPYVVIVGDKESENNTISIRDRNSQQKNGMAIEDFINNAKDLIESKSTKLWK